MINSDSQIQATGFLSFPCFLTTGKANLFIYLWSNPDLCSTFTEGDFVPRNKPLSLKWQKWLLFGHWSNDFHSTLKHKQEFILTTHWLLLSLTCRCRKNILLPITMESSLCQGLQIGRDGGERELYISSHPCLTTTGWEPLATQGSLMGGKAEGVKDRELFLWVPKPRWKESELHPIAHLSTAALKHP